MLALLAAGTGDGSVQVSVDGHGSFGRNVPLETDDVAGDAFIDQIGSEGLTGLIWDTGVIVRSPNNDIDALSEGFIGFEGDEDDAPISVSGNGTIATSSFSLDNVSEIFELLGLSFDLTQELSPLEVGGTQVGALLTQTYAVSNPTTNAMSFSLYRYMDVDVSEDTGFGDGGGLIGLGDEEWIVTTGSDNPTTDLSEADVFVAIASEGGVEPTSGRFQVSQFDGLVTTLTRDGFGIVSLSDTVTNDSADADLLIDQGSYDVTGAFRNDFSLASGESAVYTTYTVFAEGVPESILASALNNQLTINDVVIRGTIHGTSNDWDQSAWVSMKDRVESGRQFHSIATLGADAIDVHFNRAVTIDDGSELKLLGHDSREVSITGIQTDGNVLTISFDPLTIDKYALFIPDNMFTETLDGDWDNVGHMGTFDDVSDDVPPPDGFKVGDGTPSSAGGGFRLHFAYFPGDYDGDGDVDGDDYLVLESSATAADGDGNGQVLTTGLDRDIWEAYFGVFRKALHQVVDFNFNGTVGDTEDQQIWVSNSILADFNDDEVVNSLDIAIWQQFAYTTLGPDNYAQGDTDFDNDADGVDFLRILQRFGEKSAWYVDFGMDSASAMTTGTPAQVMDVIVSSSLSTHDPYSFDDEQTTGTGAQLATVPVALADTISIVFSEAVNISETDLIVVGLTTANLPQLAEFSYDPATFTAVWRFEGWALADNYLLYLSDRITDADSNLLDGEWTNPASMTATNTSGLISMFPSGDGNSGGVFSFVMTLLPGDANLDGVVDSVDQATLSSWIGTGSNALFTQGDFNGDGAVTWQDAFYLGYTWSTNLQDVFVLADLDVDGDVDNDDVDLLRANLGMTSADWEDGDLTGDGTVNQADLDLAIAQFGLDLDVAI